MFKIKVIFLKYFQKLAVKAALYALLALFASLMAVWFAPLVSEDLATLLGGDAVDKILTILATSMLAIVTFSLSTLVTSYASAGAMVSPRAAALIIQDNDAHKALSSFLGAFIFSVVSLVALSTKFYGPKGRVILFAVTIGVLLIVIITMIRWIGQLSEMSLLNNLIFKIEKRTKHTIDLNSEMFNFELQKTSGSDTNDLQLKSNKSGFIQNIDRKSIVEFANKQNLPLNIIVQTGDYVTENSTVIATTTALDLNEKILKKLNSFFLIGNCRELDNDPRFGLVILSEIGSKALSKGINDPGSAIQALGSLIKLIAHIKNETEKQKTKHKLEIVTFEKITLDDIFDDAFKAIARDGAAMIEVVLFLQKGMLSLSRDITMNRYAKYIAKYSQELAEKSLISQDDVEEVNKIMQKF